MSEFKIPELKIIEKPCNDCCFYGRCNLQHREDTQDWDWCRWYKGFNSQFKIRKQFIKREKKERK